jgi:hypothetical protein
VGDVGHRAVLVLVQRVDDAVHHLELVDRRHVLPPDRVVGRLDQVHHRRRDPELEIVGRDAQPIELREVLGTESGRGISSERSSCAGPHCQVSIRESVLPRSSHSGDGLGVTTDRAQLSPDAGRGGVPAPLVERPCGGLSRDRPSRRRPAGRRRELLLHLREQQ